MGGRHLQAKEPIAVGEMQRSNAPGLQFPGRFGKGVAKAGSAKQINNSLSKGIGRFSQGVAGATGDYAEGVAPFLEIISRTNLPPRGPKGDPQNIARVAAIATALHAGKIAGR